MIRFPNKAYYRNKDLCSRRKFHDQEVNMARRLVIVGVICQSCHCELCTYEQVPKAFSACPIGLLWGLTFLMHVKGLEYCWCLINFDYCYHCQIIITVISNKCAIPRAVSFTCERRAHFVYHHTTNIVVWVWPRVQRSKFKDMYIRLLIRSW